MCMVPSLTACVVKLHALECEYFFFRCVRFTKLFKVLVAVVRTVKCPMEMLEVMTNLGLF